MRKLFRILCGAGLTLGGAVIILRVINTKFLNCTKIDLRSLSQWAVVTGATDGIGKAFTHELAKKGFNIVLISGNLSFLRDTAESIEETFHVTTKIIQADFSMNDLHVREVIQWELDSLEIGVLVNNVVDHLIPHPEYFLDLQLGHRAAYDEIIRCNVWSTVNLTRLVMPGMVERQQGLIINVSSLFAEFPAPLDSLYAASQAFVTKFSKDLDLEYREQGVHVHVLNVGLVSAPTDSPIKGWFPVISPENYVRSALVEATRKRASTGHILHTVYQMLGRLTNGGLLEMIVLSVMKTKRKILREMCLRCVEASKRRRSPDNRQEEV